MKRKFDDVICVNLLCPRIIANLLSRAMTYYWAKLNGAIGDKADRGDINIRARWHNGCSLT
jgi:hypothetical protein